jgi:hypothetical protein
MVEEGYDWFKTPFFVWLNYCLMKTLKNGGKVKLLTEYNKEVEKNDSDILNRLEQYQNDFNEW